MARITAYPVDTKPTADDWILTVDNTTGKTKKTQIGYLFEVGMDPLAAYKITDIDGAGDPQYYGYVDASGNWYIMKLTATQARYCKGSSDYVSNWADRVNLSYDYFDNVF